MSKLSRSIPLLLLLLAAVWALGVGVFILITPQTVHEITAQQEAGEPPSGGETTRQVSWYQAQGAWGVIVLLIFALLYAGPAFFARRGLLGGTLISGGLALVLTYLAGFSIGFYYLPSAALLLAVGAWAGLARLLRRD